MSENNADKPCYPFTTQEAKEYTYTIDDPSAAGYGETRKGSRVVEAQYSGLTKREYAAIQIMAGLAADVTHYADDARTAVDLADALFAALAEKEGE